MRINLSPQRRDDALALSLAGEVLSINGQELDLSQIPEGATYPEAQDLHPLLTGEISRADGEVELTLILPHGPNASRAATFPEPIVVTEDGPIALPE